MNVGDLDGAISSFKHILLFNPTHTPSYLNLGVLYTRKGQLDQAIDMFERAIEMDSNLFVGHLMLGQAYAAKNLNRQAITSFERVIALNKNYPGGYYFLGLIYKSEGEIKKSIELFRTAVSLESDASEVKKSQQQLDLFQKNANDYFEKGTQLMKKGAVDEASDLFKKGLVIDPDHPKALFSIGILFIKKGMLDQAEASLKRALKKDPDLLLARLFLGESYEKREKVGEAILEYQSVIKSSVQPDQNEALLARRKLDQIGETPEIGKIVQSLLQEGVRLLRLGDLESARAKFLVVLVFVPKQVRVHYLLGQIAFKKNALVEAGKRFKEAIDLDRKHFPSYLFLGELYERQGKNALAILIYQEASQLRPLDEEPYIRMGILFEKKGDKNKALEVYHKLVSLPEGKNSSRRGLAQGRIDFYENRFKVNFSESAITYDSNNNQSQNPLSEVTSETNFGFTYFVKKEDRYRIPLQFNLNARFLHHAQLQFLSTGLGLFYIHTFPSYTLLQGYNFRVGSMSGNNVKNGKSFQSNAYTGEITKQGDIPSSMTLRLVFQDISVFSNPIFNSKRLTGTGILSQKLSIGTNDLGTMQGTYTFLDNDIEANDQTRRSQTLALRYRRQVFPKLTGSLGFSYTRSRFLNNDSLALTQGNNQKRRNTLTSVTAGLSYELQPGLSVFANYSRNKNKSNLPVPSAVDIVDINSGQVSSLGSYDQTLFSFGMSSSKDLKIPHPHWKDLSKHLSVGLTTGYYQPSLKDLNRIIADPKQVITQDPNHLLPSNPDFLSEARNLKMGKIKASTSIGVEVEWELNARNGLVLSLSEWQSSSVRTDLVPLLLSPNEPPLMVPRSARYNLTTNQLFLTWRHTMIKDPSLGRLFLDLGLIGASFTNLTIDSLMKVEQNPVGNPFASLGSIEARGTSFTTRLGLGGELFIRPWLSIGLNVNYLWGETVKLKVERAFPSDFRVIPSGLPGITETPCFRLIDIQPLDETVNTLRCEGDQVAEGTQLRALKLRLNGYEARMALRFHFGERFAGRTAFERWVNWGEKGEAEDNTRGPFWKQWFSPGNKSRLNMDGTLKHETAYRIHKPVTFTKALTLLRLNTRYLVTPNIRITGLTRGFYDAVYDFVDIDTISPRRFDNTILTQLPQIPSAEEVANVNVENSRDVAIKQWDLEMRELYIDFHFKQMDIRIGKQIVRWGVVPGARVTDEINPFDFGEFILRETEDRFIPLMMVKADFFSGSSGFELIWITEVVPHKPAPEGSEFEQLQILPGFVAPASFLDGSLNLNAEAFKNTELAGRLTQNFKGWEIGLTAFYTWDDFPASFRQIEGSGGGGFQSAPEVLFSPRMNRLTIFGTTLTKSFGRFVLNAEYAYVFGKFFGTLLKVADTGNPNDGLGELERDFMKYAVGLDFRLLNIDLSVQLIQAYIPDWDETILQDKIDSVAALFGRKTFLNERLVLKMLTLYFINEEDYLLRPTLETRLTDNVKTIFGADVFIGDRGQEVGRFDFIGFFKDSSRLYLEVIYSF